MSGHSKWHNIQKTKGAQDAKRAQAFTKIAREMIVAVKTGGSGARKARWTVDMWEDYNSASESERAEMIRLWGEPR